MKISSILSWSEIKSSSMKMLFNILTLIVTGLLFMKCDSKNTIENHFHLYKIDNSGVSSKDIYGIFEIVEDTIIGIVYKNQISSKMGFYDGKSKSIEIPDYHGAYTYDISNDTKGRIILTNARGEKYLLLSYDGSYSHFKYDYFINSKVNTPLFKISKLKHNDYLDLERSLLMEIYVGNPKDNYKDVYVCETEMVLGDKVTSIMSTDNLELFFEQARIKIPERNRDRIRPALFIDSNLVTQLFPVFSNYFNSKGIDSIFITKEYTHRKDSFQVVYSLFPTDRFEGLYVESLDDFINIIENNQFYFTSSRYTEDDILELQENLNYGSYFLYDTSSIANQIGQIDVSFENEFSTWRLDQDSQEVVSVTIQKDGLRLWNGLEIGEEISNYDYLCFTYVNDEIVTFTELNRDFNNSMLKYKIEIENGVISSIKIKKTK